MNPNKKETGKTSAWADIRHLIRPWRKQLFAVFAISLLATGITLLEPLIYREAVNDIAGLFVRPDSLETAAGGEDPIPVPFLEKWFEARDSASLARDTTVYTLDTVLVTRDTTILRRVRHPRAHRSTIVRRNETLRETHIVRQPHTQTRVAPRTPRQAFTTLVWAVGLLFAINIVGLIFWRIGENRNVRLSCAIERSFIRRTFGHVLKLPLGFFAKRSSAALQKQIDQSEEISGTVSHFTKDIFPEIVSFVGITAIMFYQNAVLALLALSIVPLYIWLTIRSTRKLEMSLSGYYEKWENVSAEMLDALRGVKTVKLSGSEEREVERLDADAGGAYDDYEARSFLANRYTFWQTFLTHLATALVLSYGGYLALHHRLTPGDVVMFVAYLDMLYSPIDQLAGIWAEVQQNVTSIARAFRLLHAETAPRGGRELAIRGGLVEFRDVRFGYSPDRPVLRGLSFVARPGLITAIVGPSGAGKTTAVDLLLKLYEPQSGEIRIDDQPLSAFDELSVRQQIGVVAADGAVFRGTLADNIRYKTPQASDDRVREAAVAAGLGGTLDRLPDGLGTEVGENGIGLSVGERQRLQIARVIVDRPRILILDEATANLDYVTESEIKQTLETIRRESTVIVIAHRFSLVKDADRIVVLDAGRIAEEGTPAELLARGGWFAEFAASAGEAAGEETKALEGDDEEPGEETETPEDDDEEFAEGSDTQQDADEEPDEELDAQQDDDEKPGDESDTPEDDRENSR